MTAPTTKQPVIDIDAVPVGVGLDALVATVIMGWKQAEGENHGGPGWRFFKIADKENGPIYLQDHVDKFSTDANHVCEVESEIERRGLQWSYEVCLLHQVWKPDGLHVKRPEGNFDLINATPEQKCRAALKAVMG